MNKGTIIKYTSIVCGTWIGAILISKHPIPIVLLSICAAAYFIGDYIEKGKIDL